MFYLHVVEGSPLELVELLLLESSLSGGCSEHIGVGQAGKAPDIKSVFSKICAMVVLLVLGLSRKYTKHEHT